MKKKLLLIISIVAIFISVIFVDKLLFSNNNIEDGFNDLSQVKHVNTLSMMLEQNAGEGDYELETRSSWPTKDDGYVFNSTLSKCENGSKLRWDDENNTVLMVGTTQDKCYVYFNLIPLTLANWVIEQYDAQTSGSETIYLHNSSLANGAGDNSYRYSGAHDEVNNFVCFGSDATTCPDDNLYRIIGVFGDQVKLIKWDYATSELLGTNGGYGNTYFGMEYSGTNKGTNLTTVIGGYYWNRTGTNTWNNSTLNTVNLNTNFLANIGTIWSNKIAITTWKTGGNTYQNIHNAKAATAYTNEYTSPAESTTEIKKISLMYTSDYGFAGAKSIWKTSLSSYNSSSITGVNWMYMGLYEWTFVRISDNTGLAFAVYSDGFIDDYSVSDRALAVRPVFHLNSNVEYVSGTGTKSEPIRIK